MSMMKDVIGAADELSEFAARTLAEHNPLHLAQVLIFCRASSGLAVAYARCPAPLCEGWHQGLRVQLPGEDQARWDGAWDEVMASLGDRFGVPPRQSEPYLTIMSAAAYGAGVAE